MLPGEEKRETERRSGGEGWAALCLKTRRQGGVGRERGADRQRRGFRGGGEGRLAGWRRGWVVSVERGGRARLNKAHVQVII